MKTHYIYINTSFHSFHEITDMRLSFMQYDHGYMNEYKYIYKYITYNAIRSLYCNSIQSRMNTPLQSNAQHKNWNNSIFRNEWWTSILKSQFTNIAFQFSTWSCEELSSFHVYNTAIDLQRNKQFLKQKQVEEKYRK